MTTAERLITVDEFYALPDPPEGGKMELVDGKVVTMSPVGRRHGKLALALGAAVAEFVDLHLLGEVAVETGFRLFPDRRHVRAPDVSFVETARLSDMSEDGFIEGPPTLAIEVMSPEDRDAEVSAKVLEYLAAGTLRVWVVRPNTNTVRSIGQMVRRRRIAAIRC